MFFYINFVEKIPKKVLEEGLLEKKKIQSKNFIKQFWAKISEEQTILENFLSGKIYVLKTILGKNFFF